jgi:hypothetical protein
VELKTDHDLRLDLPLSLSEAPREEAGTDLGLPESVTTAWVPPQLAGDDWGKVMLAIWIGARLGMGLTIVDNVDADPGLYLGAYVRLQILFWLSAEACLDYFFDSTAAVHANHFIFAFHALFHPFKFIENKLRPYFLMGFGIHFVGTSSPGGDDVFGNFNIGFGAEFLIMANLALDAGFRFGVVDTDYMLFYIGVLLRLQS